MAKIKPSDLEMLVLSVLWERGPSTAGDVLEAMPDGKKRAYTSILSVMQVMERSQTPLAVMTCGRGRFRVERNAS
ncbi:MAG: BlaI/MecI/CopY family transcriptional regulator [Phycisphaerae bacterium]|nr:BlaI/MecI/CopY family transcriptional regulator [Phycisphaerae bacterium]